MTGRRSLAGFAAGLLGFTWASGAGAAPPLPNVTLYLPRFASAGEIGQNVTATLNLSIWRTLRMAPWPNPAHLDFGSGLVIWSDDPLPEPAARAAAGTLRENPDLDIILWGSARRYGPDVVVQAYLLTRALDDPRAPPGALWTVSRAGRSLSLGAPRQLYVLGSVQLRPEVVARFSSASALRVCPTRMLNCTGPQVGPAMRALEHSGPWTSLVTPDRRKGWVYLYEIGAQPNEIAAFTGALISYFRGDYQQADRLFSQVAGTPSANPLVQEDSATLRAAALSRGGRPAAAAIDAVRRADPYSVYALQVAVMDALQRADADRTRLRSLAQELDEKSELFDPDDAWLHNAHALLETLNIRQEGAHRPGRPP